MAASDRSRIPVDNHVHTEWSWDASTGSMDESCRRALTLGLPAIAFTDHADFTAWAFPGTQKETPVVRVIDKHAKSGCLDTDGYRECLERCRARYPELHILSGIELGEPHLFAAEIDKVLAGGFDRVLGSLHSLTVDGELVYAPTLFTASTAAQMMRTYLEETLRMVESSKVFGILAHIDYPMRAWPKNARAYVSTDYEEEYRGVLRALARSGRALEVNTGGPWPATPVVRWWYEEGGSAVSFGSDAHEPAAIAKDFRDAAAIVESSGFRPGRHPLDFWRR